MLRRTTVASSRGAKCLHHKLATTAEFAKSCGAPQLELGEISDAQCGRMAGNSMSVPCVATMLLAGVLALDMKA